MKKLELKMETFSYPQIAAQLEVIFDTAGIFHVGKNSRTNSRWEYIDRRSIPTMLLIVFLTRSVEEFSDWKYSIHENLELIK